MANLPETGVWPEGIYQLETTDPVVGGPPDVGTGAGKSNIPLMQLAVRTFLNRQDIGKAFTTDNSPRSLAKNGNFQIGTGGPVVQWGEGTILGSDTSGTLITFSKTFPNACFIVVPVDYAATAVASRIHAVAVIQSSLTKNGFNAIARNNDVSLDDTSFGYIAIGW